MEIEFLGTGTSTGVPQLLCDCDVCQSSDSHDKRFRQSAILRHKGVNFLVDCGPDFRSQMLRCADQRIDALLITHIHYDHVGGLDDLRPYAAAKPFPIYAKQDVIDQLMSHQLRYCFGENKYPGTPNFTLHPVGKEPFQYQNINITPIEVTHNIPIVGYRIDDLAYITDCKSITDDEKDKLRGLKLLVINALRHEPHPTHLCLNETLELIDELKPKKAALIHFSHDIGLHEKLLQELPSNVIPAFDTLKITL